MSADDAAAAPALRIVRGDPTAEELAALVTVLASAGGAPPEEPAAGTRSQWAIPERMLRPPITPSGWWASSLPR